MASFTTRVVLHGVKGNEYDDLHTAMEESGFSRMIKGEDEKVYALPDAEYDYEGGATRQEVAASARAAANRRLR